MDYLDCLFKFSVNKKSLMPKPYNITGTWTIKPKHDNKHKIETIISK